MPERHVAPVAVAARGKSPLFSYNEVPAPRPIWFGAASRPAFGWFHGPPDGRCLGGAVICPPIGQEYIDTHFALRLLAERLAAEGFCAIRFDYDGTGDSAGASNDPGRVPSWLETVNLAAAAIEATGAKGLCLVGMRLGATMAAVTASALGRVDQLVLWDPCTGSRFLREQRAISQLTLGPVQSVTPGGLDILGVRLSDETLEDVGRLSVANCALPLARRALVLSRSDRPTEPSLGVPAIASEVAEHREASDQPDLMDKYPPHQKLPYSSIEYVAQWLGEGAADEWQDIVPPSPAGRQVVASSSSGMKVTETPVRIPPEGLFGILTQPEDGPARGTLPAIFVNVAKQHHVGPTRLWTELARERALAGAASLRFDLHGLGDSPRNPGQRWACHEPGAFDDVERAAAYLCPDDPGAVVLVGLCSAGYQALESALALKAHAVVAINPAVSFVPAERAAGEPIDPRRRIAVAKDEVPGLFREGGALSRLRLLFPNLAWRTRLLLKSPARRPGKWLADLVAQGTDTFLICGDRESGRILGGTTSGHLRRLQRTGKLHFHSFPGLQHDLFAPGQRDVVKRLVNEHFASQNKRVPPGHEDATATAQA